MYTGGYFCQNSHSDYLIGYFNVHPYFEIEINSEITKINKILAGILHAHLLPQLLLLLLLLQLLLLLLLLQLL